MKQIGAISQSQKLSISPQLKYSNYILQLSTLELINKINNEFSENPFLEEDISNRNNINKEISYEDVYFSYPSKNFKNRENQDLINDHKKMLENITCKKKSLYANLKEQLSLMDIKSKNRLMDCHILISFIDSKGYISESLYDLSKKLDISKIRLEKALKIIQTLEPAGIGARNLNECILLQLKNNSVIDQFIKNIILDHGIVYFKSFSERQIANQSNKNIEFIQEVFKRIRFLEPIPARQYFLSTSFFEEYIIPDIAIRREENDFKIIFYENTPKIKFNHEYLDILKKGSFLKTDSYLIKKHFEAKNICYSLYKRKKSILNVMKFILEIQKNFFLNGPLFLKPLKLADIAYHLNIHESTVSRIIHKKYILSDWGIFSIKYFLSTSIKGIDNLEENIKSTQSIKEHIKQIISENREIKQLSDQKIKILLEKKEIFIARRTVSKYRKQLKILPSFLRK